MASVTSAAETTTTTDAATSTTNTIEPYLTVKYEGLITPPSTTGTPTDISLSDNDKDGASSNSDPNNSEMNIPIYFQQDWNVGIGGGLWSTGIALSHYFISNATSRCHFIPNLLQLCQRCARRNGDFLTDRNDNTTSGTNCTYRNEIYELSILELGSGNGFLALCFMAAITLYNRSVVQRKQEQQADDDDQQQCDPIIYIRNFVITDYDTEHIQMIQTTIDKNPHLFANNEFMDNTLIVQHQWGVFPSTNTATAAPTTNMVLDGNLKFDLILGSDVVYRDYLYYPFIQSLLHFSHSDTISLIGVTMTDTKPQFFTLLDQYQLQYQKFADHLLEAQFRGTTFGIFAIQKRYTILNEM